MVLVDELGSNSVRSRREQWTAASAGEIRLEVSSKIEG